MTSLFQRFAATSFVVALGAAAFVLSGSHLLAQDSVDPVDPLEDKALQEEAAAQFEQALATFQQALGTAVEEAGKGGKTRRKNLARAELLLGKISRLTETTTKQGDTRKFLKGLDAEKLGPVLNAYVRYQRARLAMAEGDTKSADALLGELGLVHDWWLLGPFDNERGSGFKTKGPAEDKIDLDGKWKGKSRSVSWRKVPVRSRFGYVNLDAMLRPNNQAYAYAVSLVKSDAARAAALRLGSDEAVKVWWNGHEVLSRDLRRELAFDQDVVGLQMNAGWNVLLMKVHDQTGAWGFRARLTDADGKPLTGVSYATNREQADEALSAPPSASAFEGNVAEGARAYYDEVTGGAGAGARELFHLGWLHHTRGYDSHSDRKAESLLKRAMELDPENGILRFHYAEAASPPTEMAVEKEENKQRLSREKALELNPGYALAYRALATYYTSSLVNLERAETLIRKALEINPEFVEARLDLVAILSRRGLTAQAEIEREKALADPRAESLERLARTRAGRLQGQRRALAAADAWKQVLALDARSNDVRRRLVELAVESMERADAIALLDAILEMNPYSNTSRRRKAELLEGAADWDGAQAVLREALELCPEDDRLLRALGRVQRKSGDASGALATFRLALKVNPKLQELERYVNFMDPESTPYEDAYAVDIMPYVDRAANYANPENDSHVYLLDQIVNKVNTDGTASTYTHQAVKILNEGGVKQFQRFFANSRSGQAFKWKTARVIRGTGADAKIIQGKKQNNGRFRFANFPALKVGDVVDLAFRADDRRPTVFGDYFGTVNYFAGDVPMIESRYTLITPAEKPFYFHQRNLDVQPTTATSKDGKEKIYTWRVENTLKVKPEPGMPGPREMYPLVQVSTYENWDAFAAWWWGMIRDQHIASDEITKKVEELVDGKETRLEKVRAIYDFVTTDITYQAWAFGPHGYKPYTTTAIFDKREGDCKDKAILFNTMLKAIDVPAFPVLILGEPGGRSEEDLSLAMVGHFNHCISYVPDADGKGTEMWLDGTATYHSAFLPPQMDRGASVVVINDAGAQLKQIPIGDPKDNGIDQELTFTINPDGSATAEAELTFRGDGATQIRRVFSVEGQRELTLKSMLASLFGKSTLISQDFDDLRDLSTVSASFRVKFEIASFAKPDGQTFTLPTNFMGGFKDQSNMVTRAEREHDLLMGSPTLVTLSAKYILPEGWTVENAPEDVTIEHAAGGFVSKSTQDGTTLTLSRSMQLNKTRVTVDEYPSFRENLNKLSSISSQTWKVKPKAE